MAPRHRDTSLAKTGTHTPVHERNARYCGSGICSPERGAVQSYFSLRPFVDSPPSLPLREKYVFNDTVSYNVRYGNEDYLPTDAAAREYVQQSGPGLVVPVGLDSRSGPNSYATIGWWACWPQAGSPWPLSQSSLTQQACSCRGDSGNWSGTGFERTPGIVSSRICDRTIGGATR